VAVVNRPQDIADRKNNVIEPDHPQPEMVRFVFEVVEGIGNFDGSAGLSRLQAAGS
jgi:hypothetical protein